MAIIDTLRFRNILVNGDIPEEAPAEELVVALDETLEDLSGDLATKSEIGELRADIDAFKAEILAAIAQSEARLTTRLWTAIGVGVTILLAALGVATGLLMWLN